MSGYHRAKRHAQACFPNCQSSLCIAVAFLVLHLPLAGFVLDWSRPWIVIKEHVPEASFATNADLLLRTRPQ